MSIGESDVASTSRVSAKTDWRWSGASRLVSVPKDSGG